jgi:hypothetical protein
LLSQKFTKDKLKCITIDCTEALKTHSVKDLCEADIVIVPASIMEERPKTGRVRPYTENLSKKAGSKKIPPAPSGYSQREAPTIEGTPYLLQMKQNISVVLTIDQ